jgi:FkbM family methyltransferase
VFYDVGANAGFFSLVGASLVGPGGKVVAFEPHPETARQLSEQVKINGAHQIDVVVAAVSDRVGKAEFSDDTSSVMAALTDVRPDRQGRFKIWVNLTTIDRELQSRPAPDVIKIDVEGAELDVLRGASRLLREKRPMLLVELHSPEIAAAYARLMTELGYETRPLAGKNISDADSGARFVVSSHVSAQSAA